MKSFESKTSPSGTGVSPVRFSVEFHSQSLNLSGETPVPL